MTYVPVPKGKIKTYLCVGWALKTPAIFLQDTTYYPVTYQMMQDFFWDMPPLVYKPDLADCDNYAFIYKGIADRKGNVVGIVLGLYNGKLHVWNVALTTLGVFQIEPQTRRAFKHDRHYIPMIVLL